MNRFIEIASRKIGPDFEPIVIVEIGINHGGSLLVAKNMVDLAQLSGAEIIKHQTHIVDDEMSSYAKNVKPGNSDISIYEVMNNSALSEEEEIHLKNYVESKGMIFISTPFSRAAADRLEKMGVVAYKIGSGEMNNIPLIKHIAKFGKPMIVSTGMNDINSIEKTVNILNSIGIKYALLHTTNVYPTPPELVRLGGLKELSNHFPNVVFGLSDHTINNNACLAAVAMGASIIERHFTDTKSRIGPDIICSMNPTELSELIISSKEIHKMLGGEKGPASEERVTMDFAFSTVVTIKEVKVGEVFTMDNIWVKRPAIGEVPAEDYELILGMKSKKHLKPDTHLTKEDIY